MMDKELLIEKIKNFFLENTISRDVKTWGIGPWENEPENHWVGEHKGYIIAACRNRYGAWCGYVAIPQDSPYAGESYIECCKDLEIHGGITYSEDHAPFKDDRVNLKDKHWIGFDCNHYGIDTTPYSDYINDFSSKLFNEISFEIKEATYKTLDYVIEELKNLIKQIDKKSDI